MVDIVHCATCSPTDHPRLKRVHKCSAHFSYWRCIVKWESRCRCLWHRWQRLSKTQRVQCKTQVVVYTIRMKHWSCPPSRGFCLYSERHSLFPSSSSVMNEVQPRRNNVIGEDGRREQNQNICKAPRKQRRIIRVRANSKFNKNNHEKAIFSSSKLRFLKYLVRLSDVQTLQRKRLVRGVSEF